MTDNRIHYIYELIDPRNDQTMYIGKTLDPKGRLQGHIKSALKLPYHTKKNSWIKTLSKEGLKPIMNIIDEANSENWPIYERYWISQYNSWGFELTNMTEGGDSIGGCVWTNERRLQHKQRILNNPPMKGKNHSDETKKKLSDYFTSRKQSPDHIKKVSNSLKIKYSDPNYINPNKGKIFTNEVNSKKGLIGENNKMFGRTVYSVWLEKYGKDIADQKLKEQKEKQSISRNKRPGKSVVLLSNSGEILKEYSSGKIAAKENNILSSMVSSICNGHKISDQYNFKFKKDLINI